MDNLVALINDIGFPIFAFVLIYLNNKELANAINKISVTMEGMNTRLDIIEGRTKK